MARLKDIRSEPYQPGSYECCCGKSNCTDFEDRMKAWGIPLDEITTVTFTHELGDDMNRRQS